MLISLFRRFFRIFFVSSPILFPFNMPRVPFFTHEVGRLLSGRIRGSGFGRYERTSLLRPSGGGGFCAGLITIFLNFTFPFAFSFPFCFRKMFKVYEGLCVPFLLFVFVSSSFKCLFSLLSRICFEGLVDVKRDVVILILSK